ncbi:MAG: biopolymer transporter ExbD [Verrucomicrobiia bacterium]
MKRFSQKTGFSSLAELNITPLLDLAFVLLIIFVITTPLLEQGISVATPSSSPTPVALDLQSVKMVSINQQGEIFLEKEAISLNRLEARLHQLKVQDEKVAVGIRADKHLAYEKIIEVLDALQRSGITQFGLITRVED